MSIVDSSHISYARRGRHGAHYKLVKNEAGTKMQPGLVYSYEDAGEDGWQCGCGRYNWAFALECPVCKAQKELYAGLD